MNRQTVKLSQELKNIYKEYLEAGGGNPDIGLHLVSELLEQYPYFTEALLFKARMLMASGRYDEAETEINKIRDADCWNRSYIYDAAELIYRKDNENGRRYIRAEFVEALTDLITGLENFSLSVNEPQRTEILTELLSAGVEMFKEKLKELSPL